MPGDWCLKKQDVTNHAHAHQRLFWHGILDPLGQRVRIPNRRFMVRIMRPSPLFILFPFIKEDLLGLRLGKKNGNP